jgi:hypothetical protein
MSSQQPYSFFQSVEKSFDKAAKFTNWEKGLCWNRSKPVTVFTVCVFL